MTRDCAPCSKEINQYESEIVSNILKWLMVVTCIEWVRGYSDSQSLDSLDITQQYGTVTIESIDPKPHTSSVIGESTENEACRVVGHSIDLSVTLDVFNYRKNGDDSHVTSADVLLQVNDARQIERLGGFLTKNGLAIKENSAIRNTYELDGVLHSRRSSITYRICANRKTSYADDVIDGFCLSLECDEKGVGCND